MKSLKNLIPFFRKQNKISQVEFARMLGISPSYLCKIEKSLQNPSEKLIKRCVSLLGVSREQLFPDKKKKIPVMQSSHMNPLWCERIQRGIKQYDLAKRLQCSPSYLSKVENGQIKPTDYFVKQCTHFFKKNKSELFPTLEHND